MHCVNYYLEIKMNINKVILLGRIGQDPELRSFGSMGVSRLASFSLATTESWKKKDGEYENKTTWHNISAWGQQADFCEKLNKGDLIYVEGAIERTEKEGKQYFNIKAHRVNRIISNKKDHIHNPNDEQHQEQVEQLKNEGVVEDDLPF